METLLLPARVPIPKPSAGWHKTIITLADIDAQGYYKQDAFDGPLMRRLTAEFGEQAWRVALRVTGVIHRGYKTAKQLDVEGWTYDRVAKLVRADLTRPAVICLSAPKRSAIIPFSPLLPPNDTGHWIHAKDGDMRALALFKRHYSYRKYKDGREPKLFCGPGQKMVLLTLNCDALFVWRKFISMDNQEGVNCAVFRNESAILASDLIREACELAWRRWPGQRLYTYVNPKKVASKNPGYCFKMAGWQQCGVTKKGLLVFEILPAVELVQAA